MGPNIAWHARCIVCCCAAAEASAAAAVSSKTQEAYVIEGVVSRISFENDGTETQETQASIHILSDAGVQRWGVVSFSYQNFNQTLDIDYVRVKKADGTLVGHTSRKHTRHHL